MLRFRVCGLVVLVGLLTGCVGGNTAAPTDSATSVTSSSSPSATPVVLTDTVVPDFSKRVAFEDQWLRIVNDSPLDPMKVPKDLKPNAYALKQHAERYSGSEFRLVGVKARFDQIWGNNDFTVVRPSKVYLNKYGWDAYPEYRPWNYYQVLSVGGKYNKNLNTPYLLGSRLLSPAPWGLPASGLMPTGDCNLKQEDEKASDFCRTSKYSALPVSERFRQDLVMMMERHNPLTLLQELWNAIRVSFAAQRPFVVQDGLVKFTDNCIEGCKFDFDYCQPGEYHQEDNSCREPFRFFPLSGQIGPMSFEIKVQQGKPFAELRQWSKSFSQLAQEVDNAMERSSCTSTPQGAMIGANVSINTWLVKEGVNVDECPELQPIDFWSSNHSEEVWQEDSP